VVQRKDTAVSDTPEDADKIPVPESISKDTKANHAFAALKAELKRYKQQVADKESEIKRLTENQTPDLEEVMRLRGKIQEYESKLGQYDLAATAEFKQRYDARMDAAVQRGVSLLVRSGQNPEEARALMQKLISLDNMSQLQDELADQPYALQGALMTVVTEYADVQAERQQALAKWQETRAAMDFESKRSAEIKLMENVERDVGAAIENVRKAGNFMFALSDTDEAWNKQVEERINTVRGIMRSAKPDVVASLVMEGVTAKATRELFLAAHQRVQELQAQLKDMVAVSPSVHGSGAPSPTLPRSAQPRDPADVIDQLF
jgi:chromosome segregation ATPase